MTEFEGEKESRERGRGGGGVFKVLGQGEAGREGSVRWGPFVGAQTQKDAKVVLGREEHSGEKDTQQNHSKRIRKGTHRHRDTHRDPHTSETTGKAAR